MRIEEFSPPATDGNGEPERLGMYFLPDHGPIFNAAAVEPIPRVLFRLADMACSLAAFLIAYAILLWVKEVATAFLARVPFLQSLFSPATRGADLPSRAELWWVLVVVSLAMALTMEYTGGGEPLLGPTWKTVRRLLLGVVAALSAVATVFFALRVPSYSRLFLCSYVSILFVMAGAYREIVKRLQANRDKSGVGAPRVVLAGSADGVEHLLSSMFKTPATHPVSFIGCVLTDAHAANAHSSLKYLGHVSDLGDLLIHNHIDQVIVVLPDGEAGWLPEAIEHCDYFRVSMQIIHECFLDLRLRDLRHLNPRWPLPAVRLIPEEELAMPVFLWKRMLDVVLSSLALIVLAPLMAAIAVAIKVTTPGLPVFYRWNVVGYRGRRFTGYKFTTMVADADARKADLSEQNEMSGPVFKIRNDPRVTRLGKFLRKYSLNELPQFWSVLIGDMSLVGPRPAGPHELVRYELWQKRKLSVQPGITCFWQVRGRNAVSNFDDWVRMDLEYIQKRGFWTDMTILLRTVTTVLRGTGC